MPLNSFDVVQQIFFCLRYVTILTLVRVRTEQRGLYTVLVTNGDDTKQVIFDLEVQGVKMFSET